MCVFVLLYKNIFIVLSTLNIFLYRSSMLNIDELTILIFIIFLYIEFLRDLLLCIDLINLLLKMYRNTYAYIIYYSIIIEFNIFRVINIDIIMTFLMIQEVIINSHYQYLFVYVSVNI